MLRLVNASNHKRPRVLNNKLWLLLIDCAAERVWTRSWHVFTTICQTRVEVDRNAVVSEAVTLRLLSSIASFRASCLRQLRGIATRKHRQLASTPHGVSLYACIELLEHDPRGPLLSSMTSHAILPRQTCRWRPGSALSNARAHSQHHVNRQSKPLIVSC